MSLTLRSLAELLPAAAAPTIDTPSRLQYPYPGRYLLAEIHRQPQLAWNQAGDTQPPVFVDGPLWWHSQLIALQPFPLYWRNAWLQPSDAQVLGGTGEAPPWRPQYITTAVPPRSAFLTYASQWQEEEVTPVPPQSPAGGPTMPFIYVKLRSY